MITTDYQYLSNILINNGYISTREKHKIKYRNMENPVVIPAGNQFQASQSSLVSREDSTEYCGNYIYENRKIAKVLIPNGYVIFGKGNQLVYHYYIKDHLGSNRVVVDENGNIVQAVEYYASGIPISKNDLKDNHLHTGKGYEGMHGLHWYDNNKRIYDPILYRFTTMDPLCEKYYDTSPYAYCGNNPVNRIDPTGMIWDDVKEAERLKGQIDDRIASLNKNITNQQAKLDKGGLSDKQVAKIEEKISESQSRISNLNISKSDIDKLGADENNVYALSPISGGEHKVRQGDDGKIHIETSSAALSIHEITHVRQSLDAGGLQFSQNDELLNARQNEPMQIRYEKMSEMEVEAYKMQYSYDRSFPGITKKLQGIDVHSVENISNNGENSISLHK